MARKVTTLYMHNDIKGCVSQSRSRASGAVIGIYHAEQAALDPEGGPWVTVCEDHGCLCNHETLALAKQHAGWPEWCADCSEAL
jgi:hypothetical protein